MLPTFLLEPSFMQQSACRTHSGRVYILPGCVQCRNVAKMKGKDEGKQATSIGKSVTHCQESFPEGMGLHIIALIGKKPILLIFLSFFS